MKKLLLFLLATLTAFLLIIIPNNSFAQDLGSKSVYKLFPESAIADSIVAEKNYDTNSRADEEYPLAPLI